MKTTIIFALSMFIAAFAAGQNKVMDEIEVIPPQLRYQHCCSINDYLMKYLEFPANENKFNCQGTVVIEFIVHPNSKVSDFTFINRVNRKVDNEVLQVIKSTNGLWNPGYADQKAVPMRKEISVIFYVDSLENIIRLARNQSNKANEWLFVENNPKKALKHFNKAMVYLPYETSLLVGRAICREKLGDMEGAALDLERANLAAITESHNLSEMVAIRTGK